MSYNLVEAMPDKIREAFSVKVPKIKKFKRLIVVGMGGSYIAGLALKSLLDIPVQVENDEVKNTKDDLVLFISYSGNSKEIVHIYNKTRGNKLVLTSGGRLWRLAKKNKTKIIEIPENLNPRFVDPESIFPVIKCLEENKIIKKFDVNEIVNSLTKNRNKLEKEAKEYLGKLDSRLPLIYSSDDFYSASYRLMISFQEDGKMLSHLNKIPEMFHNEIEALPDIRFFPFIVYDNNKLYDKKVNFLKRTLKSYYEFGFKESKNIRLFLLFYFIDFFAFYLAKNREKKLGLTPVIDKVKRL